MSAGRPVSADNPSARRAAELALDAWPFPDSRQAVARVLVAYIKDDGCMVWPSALRLAHRAGVSEDTVQRALAEFDRKGLTVRMRDFEFPANDPDDDGKPRRRIARRVDMHRLHDIYPENIGWNAFLERGRAKQQKRDRKRRFTASRGNPPDASITAPGGNPSHAQGLPEAFGLPQTDGRVTANGAPDYRTGAPDYCTEGDGLPHETHRIAAPCSTSVLERLPERIEQRSGERERAALIAGRASARRDVYGLIARLAEESPQVRERVAALALPFVEAFGVPPKPLMISRMLNRLQLMAAERCQPSLMIKAVEIAKPKLDGTYACPWVLIERTLTELIAELNAKRHDGVSVDAMMSAYQALCRDGLCSPMDNQNDRRKMRTALAALIERGATEETMRDAVPLAKATLRVGQNPRGPTLVRAMRTIMEKSGEPFFSKPVHAAFVAPGNETRH
ncbi:hypothetical protein AB4Y40_39090 [Paraburkholderia sp. EG287B]|uniref:hypothetical protein n=1 Tax=Paraburkholderia sp. EG287B TaxID=3237010 RepID=UPI0034D33A34